MQENLFEIVLTGGPCAGKTTGLSYLYDRLTERGFRVFVTPEVSTTLIRGGLYDVAELPKTDREAYYLTQKEFVLMQRDFRARFQALAACFPEKRCVILHDRAEMDTAAYLNDDEWERLCKELDLDMFLLRDSYNAVVHMVTVAKDVPELYTLETNPARQERDVAAACAADDATLSAWSGHPRLYIVGNSTDFGQKLNQVLQVVLGTLGEPALLHERRFLLEEFDLKHKLLQSARVVEIEETPISSADPRREIRIARRVEVGHVGHFRIERIALDEAQFKQEKESFITPAEYQRLLPSADSGKPKLRIKRYHFNYQSNYCRLDICSQNGFPNKYTLLSVDEMAGEEAQIPPFKIKRELKEEEFLFGQ